MSYNNLLIEIQNRIATVIINRPKKLNALNKETLEELHDVFKNLKENKDVKVIILTGSGLKAFVAGADISEFAQFNTNQGAELAKTGQELVFNYIENMNKPVIAAINGFALGGGLELAMACHFRIASDNAKMGLPEVSLGVIPGYGGTQRLTNLVGKGKAMEMILTATMLDAQQAKEYHLVNYVTEANELLAFTTKIANKIIRNSSIAISAAIKAVNAVTNKKVNGYDVEIKEFGNCFETEDFVEGTSAFLEKRKPNFK